MAEPGNMKARRWLTLGGWLLIVVALTAGFAHNFSEMWMRWFPAWDRTDLGLYDRIVEGESYYTHAPLVPIVSLVICVLLIRHTSIPVRPSRVLGSLVLAGSLLLHLTACLARVNFASGFAFIGVLAGLILLLWGRRALRRLWFPLALLVFLVPLPEVTIAQLNFRLKMFAADWGVRMVNLVGTVAERSGNRVFLHGNKSLVIANVCNGLRTLISLLAFGALYAYVCKLRGLWRIWLFAMSVPVAIVSNSLRVASLILVADIWDVETATSWYHDTSGILIFLFAFLMMFGLERLVLWLRKLVRRPAKVLPLFDGARRGPEDEDQWPNMVHSVRTARGWVAGAMLVLAASGAWWLNRAPPHVWGRHLVSRALPSDLVCEQGRWRGYDMRLSEQVLTVLGTRDYLLRRYVRPGEAPVDVAVIFSMDNRKGTHPPDLCLEGTGQEIIAKADLEVARSGDRDELPCRELLIQSGSKLYYFLYTYKCGQTYTRSFWRQQLTIFMNGMLNRNSSGALIRISTRVTGEVEAARRRAAEMLAVAAPHLDRGLP